MTIEELKNILEKHKKWTNCKSGGERANLSYANLSNADLSNADLSRADLSGANLSDANLHYANLIGADLSYASLIGANLSCIIANEGTSMFWSACPDEGEFIAWKKCRDTVIVKLLIPADAKRSSATTRKCRSDKAVVLDVIGEEVGVSQHDASFMYKKGETVRVKDFDEDRWNECSTGIHFFITRKEAEVY